MEALTITVSADAVVTEDNLKGMMEVVKGQLVPASTALATLSGDTITLSDILIPSSNPMRLFLIPYAQKTTM